MGATVAAFDVPRRYSSMLSRRENYPVAAPGASRARLQAVLAGVLSRAQAQDLRVIAQGCPREIQLHRENGQ